MVRAARTVIVKSVKLPRKVFRVFVELEGMYRNMLEQLTLYASRNIIKSFTSLKTQKYRELRSIYPHLPSHYAYTACQDVATRIKSFYRNKIRKLTEDIVDELQEYLGYNIKELCEGERKHLYRTAYKIAKQQIEYEMRDSVARPCVKRISIWLDDHLWKLNGLTSIRIATHKGWVAVEFGPHKQYWRYVNRGWRLASEVKIKLDKRNRQLIIYLTFVKEVEEYKPRGYLSVDVNENNVTMLVSGVAYLFETNIEKLVLGYYYRRKKIQERYNELYGVKSRVKRKVLKKLKERKKKQDIRWKIANIIVRVAYEKRYAIVLEELGERPANSMIKRIKDKQLRHRIFQASFKGIQKVIEEKAKEYGVPVIHMNPKNTSRLCPIHNAPINYNNGSRIGKCSKGGEIWHRDVVACWNLLLKALRGNGSNAPNPVGHTLLDVSPIPLGTKAAHDPITLPKGLWTRWKSLPQTRFVTILNKMKR